MSISSYQYLDRNNTIYRITNYTNRNFKTTKNSQLRLVYRSVEVLNTSENYQNWLDHGTSPLSRNRGVSIAFIKNLRISH